MKATRTYPYLNFATNILVVIVGTALIGLLVYRSFIQEQNSAEARLLKAGDSFNVIPEINFSKTRNTVLVALDTKCSYCEPSILLCKKIIAKGTQNLSTRIIAVFDNSKADVEDYLREHQLEVEFIANVDLVITRVDMTPTFVVVDTNRFITASYEGVLSEKQEQDFFELLEKNASAQ